jgi:hypothetical protein
MGKPPSLQGQATFIEHKVPWSEVAEQLRVDRYGVLSQLSGGHEVEHRTRLPFC